MIHLKVQLKLQYHDYEPIIPLVVQMLGSSAIYMYTTKLLILAAIPFGLLGPKRMIIYGKLKKRGYKLVKLGRGSVSGKEREGKVLRRGYSRCAVGFHFICTAP